MRKIRRDGVGPLLIIAGMVMIATGYPPVSDYYFPVIWLGYILALDGYLERRRGFSLWHAHPKAILCMIPVSAMFWWIFEAFDQAVHSWRYLGAGAFTGLGYVLLASISFATVIPAIWVTAVWVDAWLQRVGLQRSISSRPRLAAWTRQALTVPSKELLLDSALNTDRRHRSFAAPSAELPATRWVMPLALAFGVACILLPIEFPRYAYPLIWGSLFFLLDPLNYWLGRSSLIQKALSGNFGTALTFGVAGLVCGFFWEAWNYWSVIKWVYNVPNVPQWRLFEMPILGYLGYIPFGLEAYAATVFVLPSLMALNPTAASD